MRRCARRSLAPSEAVERCELLAARAWSLVDHDKSDPRYRSTWEELGQLVQFRASVNLDRFNLKQDCLLELDKAVRHATFGAGSAE
jgi:hypothetical protein